MLRIRSKVGPKGQAVIPKPVREAMGIQPGDEVYFSVHEGHAHVEKRRPSELLRDYFDRLPSTANGTALIGADLEAALDEQYQERLGRESV